jgi:hypothetical protein
MEHGISKSTFLRTNTFETRPKKLAIRKKYFLRFHGLQDKEYRKITHTLIQKKIEYIHIHMSK